MMQTLFIKDSSVKVIVTQKFVNETTVSDGNSFRVNDITREILRGKKSPKILSMDLGLGEKHETVATKQEKINEASIIQQLIHFRW